MAYVVVDSDGKPVRCTNGKVMKFGRRDEAREVRDLEILKAGVKQPEGKDEKGRDLRSVWAMPYRISRVPE